MFIINQTNWDNGRGLQRAIANALPGQVIHIVNGTYRVTQPIQIECVAGDKGSPIKVIGGDYTGRYREFTPTESNSPRIVTDIGCNLFEIEGDSRRLSFSRMLLEGFESAFSIMESVSGSPSHIEILDICAVNVETVIESYYAQHLRIGRVFADNVGKSLLSTENCRDVFLNDIIAIASHENDCLAMINIGDNSRDYYVNDVIIKRPYVKGVDIGGNTRNINLTNINVANSGGIGIYAKGETHTVKNCTVFNAANVSYAAEGGRLILEDSCSVSPKNGAHIWANAATVEVERFSSSDELTIRETSGGKVLFLSTAGRRTYSDYAIRALDESDPKSTENQRQHAASDKRHIQPVEFTVSAS